MSSRIRALAFLACLAACSSDPAGPPPPPPVVPPPPPAAVATVEVAPGTATLLVSETVRLEATVRDAQGNVLSGRAITWSSSQVAIANVGVDGLVTAVAPGVSTITASVEGKSGPAQVTVESPLPAPDCRDCLEVVPSGVLLTAVGAEQQLQTFLVDGAGVRTPVTATFTSARPGVVSVTQTGLVRAAALGSAQLTAQAGGRSSAPVMALVATPVSGAVLVGDEKVRGPLTPVNPAAPLAPGYRYKVQLRDVQPTVGQLLVGTGALPVGGRVVAVTAAGPRLVDVELELRPLSELVPDLSVNETWRLDTNEPAAAVPWPGLARARAADDEPLEDGEFRLGPFVCVAEAGAQLSFPLNLVVDALEVNPVLDGELVVTGGRLQRFTVSGQVTPRLKITPKLTAAIEAELDCRKTIFRPTIPISGLLALVISPKVPIGVGFKFEAKAQVAELGFKLEMEGSLGLRAGLTCTESQCSSLWEPTAGLTGKFEPILQGLGDTRVELAASGYAFVEVELSNPIADLIEEVTGDRVEIQLFDAVGGLKQKLDIARPSAQADDAGYASVAELSAFTEAVFEASIELGQLLSVQLVEIRREASEPLERTPGGTLVRTPAMIQVPPGGGTGEPVLFRVNLDPVTYLGAESVEGVEVFWKTPTGLTSVCGLIEPDHAGQREFECELDFTVAHLGRQTFHAFVTAKIFGQAFATPFEIDNDAKVSVDVVREATLTIQTTILPDGSVGQPYSVQLTAFGGGTSPMTWSVVAGALPAGLSLNPTTGRIVGTPTEACACGVAIEVARGAQRHSRNLTLTVAGPSVLGAWSGEWRYNAAGGNRTFSVSGTIEPWDGGEFGNHLFSFREPFGGNGACGLNISGSSVTVVGPCDAFWFHAAGQRLHRSSSASFSGTTFTASFFVVESPTIVGTLVMTKVNP